MMDGVGSQWVVWGVMDHGRRDGQAVFLFLAFLGGFDEDLRFAFLV